MKDTETRVTFVMDKTMWRVVQLVASRLYHHNENDELRPCTGSVIIRQELSLWLEDHMLKWFPILALELRQHTQTDPILTEMEDSLRATIEAMTSNSAPRNREDYEQQSGYEEQLRIQKESLKQLKDLKEHMFKVGWTKRQYEDLMKGAS